MNDRELLELAAKAAGHTIDPIDAMHEPDDWACWNPLDEDGDALRLSVMLRIDLEYFDGFQMVRAEDCNGEYRACDEDYGDDIPAAVRRAIVRAAAMQAKVGE